MTNRDRVLVEIAEIWERAIGEIARELGCSRLDAILFVCGADPRLITGPVRQQLETLLEAAPGPERAPGRPLIGQHPVLRQRLAELRRRGVEAAPEIGNRGLMSSNQRSRVAVRRPIITSSR